MTRANPQISTVDLPDVDSLVRALAAAMAVGGVPETCDMLAVADGVEAAAMDGVEEGRPIRDVLSAMRLANDLRMRRPGRDAWDETMLRVRRAVLRPSGASVYLEAIDPSLRDLAVRAVSAMCHHDETDVA